MNKTEPNLPYPYYSYFKSVMSYYYAQAQAFGRDSIKRSKIKAPETMWPWILFQAKRVFQNVAQFFYNIGIGIVKGYYYTLSAGAYGLAYLSLVRDVPIFYLKNQKNSHFQAQLKKTTAFYNNTTKKDNTTDRTEPHATKMVDEESVLSAGKAVGLIGGDDFSNRMHSVEPQSLNNTFKPDVVFETNPENPALRTLSGPEMDSFMSSDLTQMRMAGPLDPLANKEDDRQPSAMADMRAILDEVDRDLESPVQNHQTDVTRASFDFDEALEFAIKTVMDNAIFSEDIHIRYIKQEDGIHFLSVRDDMRFMPKQAGDWKSLMTQVDPYFFCIQDHLSQYNSSFKLDKNSLLHKQKIFEAIDRLEKKGQIKYPNQSAIGNKNTRTAL